MYELKRNEGLWRIEILLSRCMLASDGRESKRPIFEVSFTLWVGEPKLGFQDVEFLPSQVGFPRHFLKL